MSRRTKAKYYDIQIIHLAAVFGCCFSARQRLVFDRLAAALSEAAKGMVGSQAQKANDRAITSGVGRRVRR